MLPTKPRVRPIFALHESKRMVALIKAAQLLLSLSILIFLHELGHYFAARKFNTRVEKFYLFMNPWFSLYKKQIGETEWGLGWLPLGGYVKISGMIDESMDKEQMKQPIQPWEFRAKPAWQRLIIMLGGIIVNLIVGFVVYAMVLGVWGKDVLPMSNLPYGIEVNEEVAHWGLENGDQITSINGEEAPDFDRLRQTLFFESIQSLGVVRDGIPMTLALEGDLGQEMVDHSVRRPFSPRRPCVIETVDPGSPADRGGLAPGDRFVSINGVPTRFYDEVVAVLKANPSTPFVLGVENEAGLSRELAVMTDSIGRIGFISAGLNAFPEIEFVHIDYGLGDAITGGFSTAWTTLREYALSLRFLASKSGASQVGSLVTFGSVFAAEWDWEIFWRNTAFFSLILAFMNLLPIPGLDGGHVMFLLYEMVVGKPAPQRFMEIAQVVGFIFLILLMMFALGNDLFRVFTGQF
jgi:regulator of sigma E protease